MSSGFTGFDPSAVNATIKKVNDAYGKLIHVLGDQVQNRFVGGMQDKWACNQAQQFFNESFKPAMDSLITSSTSTFNNVVDSINSAASAWAERTKSQYSKKAFSPINKKINTSVIRENINGVRGIDLQNASTVAAELIKISSEASQALSEAQAAVRGCGFIGGNQEANLVGSLEKIKNNIDKLTQEATGQTKKAIESTIAEYSDLEGKVSQAFSGQSI